MNWNDNNLCLEEVRKCGQQLRFVENQTEEICLAAVRQDGLALQYVTEQTDDICLEAVKKYPLALRWVKNQKPAIVSVAVGGDPRVVVFVRDLDEKVVMGLVTEHPDCFEFVDEKFKTHDLCCRAVSKRSVNIYHVPSLVPELYDSVCAVAVTINSWCVALVRRKWCGNYEDIAMIAVQNNPLTVKCVAQSPSLCLEAVRIDPWALEFVKNQTPELCFMAVKLDWRVLRFVRKPNALLYLMAVQQNPEAVRLVKRKHVELVEEYEEIMLAAVKQNGLLLRYCELQTIDVIKAAVEQNANALEFVRGWFFGDEYGNEEFIIDVIKKSPMAIRFLKKPNEALAMMAVKGNGLVLKYINKQTPELCLEAVKQNPFALEFVKKQNSEVCRTAVRLNISAVRFVKDLGMVGGL